MDILLSVDIYVSYFASHPFVSRELSHDLNRLLNNNQNRFLFSKALLRLIEKSIAGNSAAESLMQPFIAHLINSRMLNVPTLDDSEKNVLRLMNDTYLAMPSKDRRDIYMEISLSSANSLNSRNSVIVDKIAKPNIHWIWFNLACNSPRATTVRYYDFTSDAQIQEFFDYVLSFPQKTDSVDIFDKQVNLDHQCFLAIQSLFVNYFTCIGAQEMYKRAVIKQFFRKGNVYSAKSAHIHERRIMFNNLILEVDDDFWNISCSRTTWKIDIVYCPETRESLAKKKNFFRLLR